jgi:hypothetical protein
MIILRILQAAVELVAVTVFLGTLLLVAIVIL